MFFVFAVFFSDMSLVLASFNSMFHFVHSRVYVLVCIYIFLFDYIYTFVYMRFNVLFGWLCVGLRRAGERIFTWQGFSGCVVCESR